MEQKKKEKKEKNLTILNFYKSMFTNDIMLNLFSPDGLNKKFARKDFFRYFFLYRKFKYD